MSLHVYMDISVYIYVYGCICTYVFYFQNRSFTFPTIFLTITYQNTECVSLIMYKGEVSISDSLLLPPFSNEVVK